MVVGAWTSRNLKVSCKLKGGRRLFLVFTADEFYFLSTTQAKKPFPTLTNFCNPPLLCSKMS